MQENVKLVIGLCQPRVFIWTLSGEDEQGGMLGQKGERNTDVGTLDQKCKALMPKGQMHGGVHA